MLFETFDFKEFNESFYKVNKDTLLNFRSLSRRLKSFELSNISSEQDFVKKAIVFLKDFSTQTFTFITKENKYNVNFKEEDVSFCELKRNNIQIGIKLLTNKEIPYLVRLISLCAIIIHEYFHKRVTIEDLKNNVLDNLVSTNYYYENEETSVLKDAFFKENLDNNLKLTIFNFLEDRRIEELGVNDFQGYVFLFDILRKYGFYLHKNIYLKKHFLTNSESSLILEFLLIKILIPELVEHFIEKLKNLDFDDLLDSKIFIKFSKKEQNEKKQKILNSIEIINKYIDSKRNRVFSNDFVILLEETNEIYNLIPIEYRKELESKNLERYSIYTDSLNSSEANNKIEIDSNKIDLTSILKELEKNSKENLQDLEYEIEKEVILLKEKSINSKYDKLEIFQVKEKTEEIDYELFKKSQKISKEIFKNLSFLNSRFNRIDFNYEITEGEIDEDELYSIKYSNNIFFDEEVINGYEMDIGLLLDESGSIGEDIYQVKEIALALILAIQKNKNINLFVYGHTANDDIDYSKYTYNHLKELSVQMFEYWNSLKGNNNVNKIFTAESRANNADGYAIEYMNNIMSKTKNKSKLLIVISDGQPNAISYQDEAGIQHTKQVIDNLETNGVFVVQICIKLIENSPKMFKHYIQYDSNQNFILNFKKLLLRRLYKILIQV